jgi:hypothetical protein
MSQVDYAAMSDRELKAHWRAHPQDQRALQAHLDRLNQMPRPVITTINDPNFDIKLQQEIERQIAQGQK